MSVGSGVDVNVADTARCRACAEPLAPADRFCEACGAAVSADGQSRTVSDLGTAVAVSDPGRRRAENADAAYVNRHGSLMIAAVCDGVGSSPGSRSAAHTAARAAVQAVVAALPASPESQFASLESRESACRSAVEAARREVTALGDASDGSSPACTLVLGLVHERSVTVASVGDSRAYWLGPDSHQLTIDDSVAQMRISAGLSEKEALASPDGHTITNWIGEDAPSDPPQIASFDAATPGHLLLCTDGLWNYFPAPIELFEIIDQVSTASVVAGALKLVEAALEAGGHDNVGVALVAVTTDGPRSPTREITTEIPTETTTETTTETVTELVTR